jgi:hypothetical protein
LLTDAAYAGAGLIGTKFVVGAILPAIGIPVAGAPSITTIFAKGAAAYVVAWGGEKFIGSHTFMPLFLGGAMSAIQDLITLYLVPSFPGLAADELQAYYRAPLAMPRRAALPSPHVGAYAGELSAEDMI